MRNPVVVAASFPEAQLHWPVAYVDDIRPDY